ncbi:MAG: hypothetical protein QM751_10825 [Paludibacteraceae bacterium]
MKRNLDRGLDKKVEIQRSDDAKSKTPKMDKIKRETGFNLIENFKNQR